MSRVGRERMYRFSVALAALYGLLAVQHMVLDGGVESAAFLQSLILGWTFAVTAVVASVVPARPPPPHVGIRAPI